MHLLPQLFLFLSRCGIYFPQQKLLLPQEFLPILQSRRIQGSYTHGSQYGASRLAFMAAVDKAALFCQRINVSKSLRNAAFCIPKLHLPQTRCIHQERAAR